MKRKYKNYLLGASTLMDIGPSQYPQRYIALTKNRASKMSLNKILSRSRIIQDKLIHVNVRSCSVVSNGSSSKGLNLSRSGVLVISTKSKNKENKFIAYKTKGVARKRETA
jgi:hypothetical protein